MCVVFILKRPGGCSARVSFPPAASGGSSCSLSPGFDWSSAEPASRTCAAVMAARESEEDNK